MLVPYAMSHWPTNPTTGPVTPPQLAISLISTFTMMTVHSSKQYWYYTLNALHSQRLLLHIFRFIATIMRSMYCFGCWRAQPCWTAAEKAAKFCAEQRFRITGSGAVRKYSPLSQRTLSAATAPPNNTRPTHAAGRATSVPYHYRNTRWRHFCLHGKACLRKRKAIAKGLLMN